MKNLIFGCFFFIKLIINSILRFFLRHIWKIILIKVTILGSLFCWSFHVLKKFQKVNFMLDCHYIYDRDDILIGHTSPTITIYKKLEEFPTILKDTILAIEDSSFYRNCGISITGLMRAMITYIPSKILRQTPKGGSTITQQLMRALFLSYNISISRKFLEIILSISASFKISKKDILEVYMNNAYFCNNIYGFNTASHIFWGKEPEELSPSEIAILVSLLRGPQYSPLYYPERLKARRNFILKKMLQKKIINEEQYNEAILEEINIDWNKFFHVNYLSLDIKNYIIKNYSEDIYKKGGLKIYTSISKNIQEIAEKELINVCYELERDCPWSGPVDCNREKKHLFSYMEKCGKFYTPIVISSPDGHFIGLKTQGKLSVSDIEKYRKFKSIEVGDVIILYKKTGEIMNLPSFNGQVTILKNGLNAGEVVASVGGIDLTIFRDNIARYIPREVGSCIKVLNCLCALDQGLPTDLPLNDSYVIIKDGKAIFTDKTTYFTHRYNFTVKKIKDVWAPGNWDDQFFGKITMRNAFEFSRNTSFMDLIYNNIGIKKYYKFLRKIGLIDSKISFFPSMVLGSVFMTPEHFAGTICGVLNYGVGIEPTLIQEITDKDDGILEKVEIIEKDRVVKKESVYIMLEMMQGAVDRGLAKALKDVLPNIYGKSGTSGNNRDVLCLCITKEYTILITLCKNDGSSLGANVWGARYPMLCGRRIVSALGLSGEPFFPSRSNLQIREFSGPYNPYHSPNLADFICMEYQVKS